MPPHHGHIAGNSWSQSSGWRLWKWYLGHGRTRDIRLCPARCQVPTYIKCKCFSPPPLPWNAAEIWKSRAGAACREEADSWCLIVGWEGAIPSTLDLQAPCLSQQSVFGLFSLFLRRLMKVMVEPLERTLIGGGRRRETYQLQDSSLLDNILVHLIFWA